MSEPNELRRIAAELKAGGMRCNCDLDNWKPERSTGHSNVCRIHKAAVEKGVLQEHIAEQEAVITGLRSTHDALVAFYALRERIHGEGYVQELITKMAGELKPPQEQDCQHLAVSQSNDLSGFCLNCGEYIPPPQEQKL